MQAYSNPFLTSTKAHELPYRKRKKKFQKYWKDGMKRDERINYAADCFWSGTRSARPKLAAIGDGLITVMIGRNGRRHDIWTVIKGFRADGSGREIGVFFCFLLYISKALRWPSCFPLVVFFFYYWRGGPWQGACWNRRGVGNYWIGCTMYSAPVSPDTV